MKSQEVKFHCRLLGVRFWQVLLKEKHSLPVAIYAGMAFHLLQLHVYLSTVLQLK